MTFVTIREVSLRDGLQIESPISLEAKLELLDAVLATGVREVEVTAFVSPSKVPALADAAALAAADRRCVLVGHSLGGYAAESEAGRICASLGLPDRVLTQPLRTLSGGQRRRVELARILFAASDAGSGSATTLLLDEPTNHLDIRHQFELLALIRALPVTAVVTLHDLTLAALFCDRLVVLDKGRVVAAGAPAEVLTAELISSVYGVAARVTVDDTGRPSIQLLPP